LGFLSFFSILTNPHRIQDPGELIFLNKIAKTEVCKQAAVKMEKDKLHSNGVPITQGLFLILTDK